MTVCGCRARLSISLSDGLMRFSHTTASRVYTKNANNKNTSTFEVDRLEPHQFPFLLATNKNPRLRYELDTRGGTDTHLFLLDLRPNGIDGVKTEKVLQDCAIVCNRSRCPGDSPLHASGLRLGSPALTSRGLVEKDFCKVAELLHTGIQLAVEIQTNTNPKCTLKEFTETLSQDDKYQKRIKEIQNEVEAFVGTFPLPGLPGL